MWVRGLAVRRAAIVLLAVPALLGLPAPSVEAQTVPTITTTATPTALVGQPIMDTATISDTPGPATGTVTFTLYGPDDATCAGAPVFTSPSRPLTGAPQSSATSDPFTPTAPGTYRWVAQYSGDANNVPVTSACNSQGETSEVSAYPLAVPPPGPAREVFVPASPVEPNSGAAGSSAAGRVAAIALLAQMLLSVALVRRRRRLSLA